MAGNRQEAPKTYGEGFSVVVPDTRDSSFSPILLVAMQEALGGEMGLRFDKKGNTLGGALKHSEFSLFLDANDPNDKKILFTGTKRDGKSSRCVVLSGALSIDVIVQRHSVRITMPHGKNERIITINEHGEFGYKYINNGEKQNGYEPGTSIIPVSSYLFLQSS